jgi:hypothetical protein
MTPLFRTLPLVALLYAMPVMAGDTARAQTSKHDPNKMICEDEEVVGSRLATKRVCMTRAQWAERRQNDRALIDRSQTGVCQRQAGC